MKLTPNRFWWTVFALGCFFDILFWKKVPGINIAIFIGLCLSLGIFLLKANGHQPRRNSLLLLLPITLFAVITFTRQEPLTVFLSIVQILFLMGLFTITFSGGRWPAYGLLNYLAGGLSLLNSMITRPLIYASEKKSEENLLVYPNKSRKISNSQFWPIVRGILIALPIVAIFASLLSSADLIFGQLLQEFMKWFNFENLPIRLIYILALGYIISGAYLHAALQSQDDRLIGEDTPLISPFLGFTEAGIVLGSVTILFTAFVIIQFQYFFGGQTNIQINGFTYSEYARRGFGELIAVAFFSLLLILSASGITRRETIARRRVFSGLGVVIVMLVLVMLISAFQRLLLYEEAYGFTRLRTYTHVFMIWLALLLVAVSVLEIFRRERAFVLASVLTSLGFALSIGIMNVDGFIVRKNVKRAVQGEDFDVSYLADLSSDAVPTLANEFHNQYLPATIKEGVGAALACYAADKNQNDQPLSWQSFHFSREAAARYLTSLRDELTAYQVDNEDWSFSVVTPLGVEHSCYSFKD